MFPPQLEVSVLHLYFLAITGPSYLCADIHKIYYCSFYFLNNIVIHNNIYLFVHNTFSAENKLSEEVEFMCCIAKLVVIWGV